MGAEPDTNAAIWRSSEIAGAWTAESLVPGGWHLSYDPVRSDDPVVAAAAWERVADREDPEAARKGAHRSHEEQARRADHLRYLIPLGQQLAYLRSARFEGIDVYWKRLEYLIYGGYRPA